MHSRRLPSPPLNRLQVLDRRGPSHIEQVLADSQVPRSIPLPRHHVREPMLRLDPSPQYGPAFGASDSLPPLLLLPLVLGDRHAAALVRPRVGALGPLRASPAHWHIEPYRLAQLDDLLLPSGAADCHG